MPSFTLADCELLGKYESSKSWNDVPPEDKTVIESIRGRLRHIAERAPTTQSETVALRSFVSHLCPNGRSADHYWCCVFPKGVPNKSFGLQVTLILDRRGAELAFCLGAGRSTHQDPAVQHRNQEALRQLQSGLRALPDQVISNVAATLNDKWRFRRAWRLGEGPSDYPGLSEWLAFAASAPGEASISKYFSPEQLETTGGVLAEEFLDAVRLFSPIFEAIYGQGLKPRTEDTRPPGESRTQSAQFISVMKRYWSEGVVFQSAMQGNRYCVCAADDNGCSLLRLDANETTERCTAAEFDAKLALLVEAGGERSFGSDFDNTVAKRTAFLQALPFVLSADHSRILLADTPDSALSALLEALRHLRVARNNGQPYLYKPLLVACVLRGIMDGQLRENKISFDWILPRFLTMAQKVGIEATGVQAAEAFYHLTGDLFWMLAYPKLATLEFHQASTLSVSDIPLRQTPSLADLRRNGVFATIKDTYWNALQHNDNAAVAFRFLFATWWPHSGGNDADAGRIMPTPYTLDDAAKDLFFSPEDLQEIVGTLQHKKNIILQGPPGVGKTFAAKRIAYALIGAKDEQRTEMVQFHPSYSYEDFVEGIRPDGTSFDSKPGPFLRFCTRAARTGGPHVFIIDEINRGDLARVFGELLMLIEHDKRDTYSVIRTYAKTESDRLSVPGNLYLIGLMNTADRSLAMVDYALRRRFRFFDIEPQFASDRFQAHLISLGVDAGLVESIVRKMRSLNRRIAKDTSSLGPGFEIGHSYFCPSEPGNYSGDWYHKIILREIVPLLREYWFDSPNKLKAATAFLLSGQRE